VFDEVYILYNFNKNYTTQLQSCVVSRNVYFIQVCLH